MRPAVPQILVAIILVVLTANVIIYSQMYTGVIEPTGATSPLCGNNEIDLDYDEECDGIDDELCPDQCLSTCLCPPVESKMRANVPLYGQTFYFNDLDANETVKINATKPEFAFVSISFPMPNSTNNLSFTIDSNMSHPTKSRLPSGILYEYMNFSYKCNDTRLEDFTIEYRVSKEWIIENNIDYSTIRLSYQKAWDLWPQASTNYTEETDSYHYYSSFWSGPGLFAVTGFEIPKPAALAAPSIPYCGNGKIDENETYENCCVDVGCPEGFYCNNNKCEKFALCGNDICDYNETITNCPQDCARQVFYSPLYWLLFIGLIIISIIGFMIMTKDHKEIFKPRPRTPLASSRVR